MPQKVRNESALEVVKVGGFAVAVADSDISHRNARLGGRLKHTHAHGARKHPVGRASLRKKKCAALGLDGVNDARNNALPRLRACALHPDCANGLGRPSHKRKPFELSRSYDCGGPSVVAQKDVEVRGVVAHQNAWFIGQVPDAFYFEVQVAVHCPDPAQKESMGPPRTADQANHRQAKCQRCKEPAGRG